MGRKKHKREIHYEPTVMEVLLSIEEMSQWIEPLLHHYDKPYAPFMKWLLENNFFADENEVVTIRQLQKRYGSATSAKITLWLQNCYQDILTLHSENSEAFKCEKGIKQHFYISYRNDSTYLALWLPSVPRQYEVVKIPFLKAMFGIDYFWVERISYSILSKGTDVEVWLKGGIPNRYREVLYQRAVFEGTLTLSDERDLHDFEINDKLLKAYST